MKTSSLVIGKNDKIVSANQIKPINFEKSKYSNEEFVSFFERVSNSNDIDEIKEQFEIFASDDFDNSYSTEILNYILKNFTYLQIKFIASLYLNSEKKQLALLFERFLVNKDNLLDVINLNKFYKNLSESNYVKHIEEFGVNNIQYKSLFKEILDQFDKKIFIDNKPEEYEKFFFKNEVEFQLIEDLHDMLKAISGCKMILANPTGPLAMATVMNVPRIGELFQHTINHYAHDHLFYDDVEFFDSNNIFTPSPKILKEYNL
jgi:hypothetical protein